MLFIYQKDNIFKTVLLFSLICERARKWCMDWTFTMIGRLLLAILNFKLQRHRKCMRRSPGCCKTFKFAIAFYLLLLCMGSSFSGDDATLHKRVVNPRRVVRGQCRCCSVIHRFTPADRRSAALFLFYVYAHSLLVLLRHVPCICTLLISFGLSQRKPVDDSLSDCVLRRIKHVLSCWFDFVMTWPHRCSHV